MPTIHLALYEFKYKRQNWQFFQTPAIKVHFIMLSCKQRNIRVNSKLEMFYFLKLQIYLIQIYPPCVAKNLLFVIKYCINFTHTYMSSKCATVNCVLQNTHTHTRFPKNCYVGNTLHTVYLVKAKYEGTVQDLQT